MRKIQIQIIFSRERIIVPTIFKVMPENFTDGRAHGFKNYPLYNTMLLEECQRLEQILLDQIKAGKTSKSELRLAFGNVSGDTYTDYLKKMLTEKKFSASRVRQYEALSAEVLKFGDFKIASVDTTIANRFEMQLWAKGLGQNTMNTRMATFLAVINYAASNKKCKTIEYTKPKYIQNIPEYLTTDEIEAFKNVTLSIVDPASRICGLFFLLACHTGYRISDQKRFDTSFIKNGRIVIRAKKNSTVVSIPIYPALQSILDLIGENRLSVSEQTMRKYSKDIARLAGIHRRITVHSARHSFAMMLMDKGFTLSEAAELLGDSDRVAKIYARISNRRMDSVIKDKLG